MLLTVQLTTLCSRAGRGVAAIASSPAPHARDRRFDCSAWMWFEFHAINHEQQQSLFDLLKL
jgi:hypothetical protein